MRRSIALKLTLSVCLLFSLSFVSRSQSAAVYPDLVLRAMVDELQRSVSELQFKDLEKPYFIQYIVLDQERYRASATFPFTNVTLRSL